jgi:hypothetical protein
MIDQNASVLGLFVFFFVFFVFFIASCYSISSLTWQDWIEASCLVIFLRKSYQQLLLFYNHHIVDLPPSALSRPGYENSADKHGK